MVRDSYKEIYVLRNMLENAKIPFVFRSDFLNGCAIGYPEENNFKCSVIEHDGSYGGQNDLLEIMGLLTDEERRYDEVIGYLTAKEVFKRIKNDYELSR